jgi:hypothetical protein
MATTDAAAHVDDQVDVAEELDARVLAIFLELMRNDTRTADVAPKIGSMMKPVAAMLGLDVSGGTPGATRLLLDYLDAVRDNVELAYQRANDESAWQEPDAAQ